MATLSPESANGLSVHGVSVVSSLVCCLVLLAYRLGCARQVGQTFEIAVGGITSTHANHAYPSIGSSYHIIASVED